MTSLQITPTFARKTSKIVGTIASGEHVAVTVVGGNSVKTSTLYLRIVCCGKTIAQFPQPVEFGETQEEWTTDGENITAVLNLNTVEAHNYCRGPQTGCLAILEDLGDSVNEVHPQLYFVSDCLVNGWPKKLVTEGIYSLDAYPGLISQWATMIGNLSVGVTKVDGVSTIRIVNKDGTVTTAQVADGNTPTWDNLTGKPEVYPPNGHIHGTADVTGLSTALSAKLSKSELDVFNEISDPAASTISLKTCVTHILGALKGLNS